MITKNDLEIIVDTAFSKIMKINLETDEFFIYKMNEGEQVLRMDFSDWIEIFEQEGWIHPDDIEKYYKHYLNLNILCHFKKNNEPLICRYRRKVKDDIYTVVQSTICKAADYTEDSPSVLLYLMNLGVNNV